MRLHEAIGYVTPDDEHQGRGERIRQAGVEGWRVPLRPATIIDAEPKKDRPETAHDVD